MKITTQGLAIGYDTPLAVDLNFEVKAGEVLGLVGANGTGKTTLLRTLLGLNQPLGGSYEFAPLVDRLRAESGIGVVWQDAGLPFNISSARWITHLAQLHNQPIDTELISKLGVPRNKRQIRSLSGGEKQRLAIYSAVFFKPQLLILDEPTVGLDEATREIFYDLMAAHKARGGCAIVTSHYAVDISAISTSILNLSNSDGVEAGAIFNTSLPLSEEVLEKFAITRITNGYQISTSNPWNVLSQIRDLAQVEITNFRLVNHA